MSFKDACTYVFRHGVHSDKYNHRPQYNHRQDRMCLLLKKHIHKTFYAIVTQTIDKQDKIKAI